MVVSVECLGEPTIVFEGERLTLRGQQPVTLAALVAAGPEGTTKARLYEELFGDDLQSSGEQAVTMRIQRLRKKVRELAGEIEIITSGQRVGIDPAMCSVDVWEFDDTVRNFADGWEATLGRWREPYRGLPDLPSSVLFSGERLRNTYRAGLAQVGWTIEAGSPDDLIEQIAQEIGYDPFNERLATSHAVALYRTGRQPDALAALTNFRSRLLDAHGLNPSAEFDQIEHAALDNNIDPIKSPHIEHEPQITTPRLAEPTRFLGRDDLVDTIERRLTALGSSSIEQDRLHVIVGPGGSGKSTLLAKVLAPLDGERVTVHIGSAQPDGGSTGSSSLYRPFAEAFPALEPLLSAAGPADEGSGDQQFWHDVHRTLHNAATANPTVLVLENMHDADSASVGLLRFLIGASQHPRLLIFATTREPVEGTPWHETFKRLTDSERRVTVHALEPMPLADIQHLVAMDHPSQPLVVRERFARRLESVSGGNALVATALSRDAMSDLDMALLPGTPEPEDAYFSHVNDRINDRQLEQILWVAAMIGLEFESTVIEDVLDLDQATVERQLERFTRLHLGHRLGLLRWRFDHLLTLNAIASGAGLMRPLLLARLARAGTDNPLRMLRYIEGAGVELPPEFRIEELTGVAELLEEQGAHDEAARAWTMLSELLPSDSPERVDSLVGAAAALSRVGRRDRAAQKRTEAVELARSLGDGNAVFRAALAGLPSGEYVGGEPERLATLINMTPEERAAVPPLEHAKWSLRFARICDDTDTARSLIESIDPAWPGDVEQLASLELERLCFEAQCHDAARVLPEMRDLAEICPEGPQRSDHLHRAALIALMEHAPADEVRKAVEVSATYARTHGTPRTKWSSDVLASTLATVGLIDSAATPSSARNSGHRWGIPDVEDNFFAQSFIDLWFAGHVGLAQAAIDQASSQIAMNIGWHAALSLSAAANGARDRALSEAAIVMQLLDERPDGTWAPAAAALLAEAAAALDDPDVAKRAIEALRPRSGLSIVLGIGSAHFGPVDRYLGIAASVIGDPDAPTLLHGAAEQARHSGITVWEQRTEANIRKYIPTLDRA